MRFDARKMKYIEKWKDSNKDLNEELKKWADMLWLGRSLSLIEHSDKRTRNKVIKIQKQVVNKWKNDPDFNKYMYSDNDIQPDKEYGDSYWAEISCNVGALRYLLNGEWNTDS